MINGKKGYKKSFQIYGEVKIYIIISLFQTKVNSKKTVLFITVVIQPVNQKDHPIDVKWTFRFILVNFIL